MKKNNSSAPHSPNFSALGFFGIYFIALSMITPVIGTNVLLTLAVAAVVLVFMAIGYFLQAGVSRAMGFKRELETRAYEPEYKYFKPNRAFPVWMIAILLSFAVSFLTDRFLFERSKIPTYSYDPDSILPATLAIVFVAVVALGSFVWFFPYNRVMTGSGLITGLTLNAVSFALYTMIKAPGVIAVGFCFVGYAFCALISANQYSLGRTYRGTVVSFMTPQTRRYNLVLSLALVAVFCMILFVAYLIVNGVRVSVLFVFQTLLRAATNSGEGYTEEEEKNIFESISKNVFGTKDAASSVNYWLYWVFVVMTVVALVVVFVRRRPEFKRIIAWIKAKIVALFEFFWLPVKHNFEGEDYYFSNYVDEEIKLQKHEISSNRGNSANEKMTWREFSIILRTKRSEEEKYRYAYSVFVDRLRRMPMFVRKSDTPRKIRERLSASGKVTSKREIEMITEAFEQIEYAGKPATPETEKALEALCDKIRENM